MLSVKAIYDGERLHLLEPVEVNSPQEVIVTFLHDVPNTSLPVDDLRGETIRHIVGQSASFDFLRADEEDVYSDADLKIKY